MLATECRESGWRRAVLGVGQLEAAGRHSRQGDEEYLIGRRLVQPIEAATVVNDTLRELELEVLQTRDKAFQERYSRTP
jgi:hypothetical protein